MRKDTLIFIGLDTHKESSDVAYVDDEPRFVLCSTLWQNPNNKTSLAQSLLDSSSSKHPEATLHFVYEAGPCGYWIYRLLTSLGHCCYVVDSFTDRRVNRGIGSRPINVMPSCWLNGLKQS